jgi:hypothetical protein
MESDFLPGNPRYKATTTAKKAATEGGAAAVATPIAMIAASAIVGNNPDMQGQEVAIASVLVALCTGLFKAFRNWRKKR